MAGHGWRNPMRAGRWRDCARFRAKTPEQRAAAGAMMRACKAPNYRALRVLI
jgi:hypothetical protein